MTFAVGDFLRRENAFEESAAVPRDGGLDAVDLGDVRAQSDDHITPSLSQGSCGMRNAHGNALQCIIEHAAR
jgi:hypothetical protein